MTELIDNPPPLPDHKHSLNSGNFAPLYTADQYRAGEAAAFARGVAAGRNAGLEEAATWFEDGIGEMWGLADISAKLRSLKQ